MHEFPYLKHDHLRDELSKYMCCRKTMCASSGMDNPASDNNSSSSLHLCVRSDVFHSFNSGCGEIFLYHGMQWHTEEVQTNSRTTWCHEFATGESRFYYSNTDWSCLGTDGLIDRGEMKGTKSCSSKSSGRVSWNRWSCTPDRESIRSPSMKCLFVPNFAFAGKRWKLWDGKRWKLWEFVDHGRTKY